MISRAFHKCWPPKNSPTAKTAMTVSATIERLLIADSLPNGSARGRDGRRHAGDDRERRGNAEPASDTGKRERNVEAVTKNADPGNERANRQGDPPRDDD